jgi:hypothetical protein
VSSGCRTTPGELFLGLALLGLLVAEGIYWYKYHVCESVARTVAQLAIITGIVVVVDVIIMIMIIIILNLVVVVTCAAV